MQNIRSKENKIIFYNSLISFLIFTAFFLVFYFYQRTVIYDRLYLLILVQSSILILYLISIFRLKAGLFLFIFLIPLLNSVTTIIGIRRIEIIFYLFLGLFLGFLVNRFKSGRVIIFETEIAKPVFIFIIILIISSAITIYRYTNFYPFLTVRFRDLIVNDAGHTTLGAISWTLRYFFNYIIGFGLALIVLNAIKREKDFFKAIVILILTSFMVIIAGLYQKFFYPSLGSNSFWLNAGRTNSTFSDPNSLGIFIVLLFPLFIALIIFLKKWYLKILIGILLLLFVYLGFLSGSRNAFLSILITSVVFIIIGISVALKNLLKNRIKKPNSRVLFSTAIAVLFILILSLSFISFIFNSDFFKNTDDFEGTGIILVDRIIETIGDYSASLKSDGLKRAFISISSGRDVLWRQAVFMFSDHPVSGVGQGAYFIELSDYHRRHQIGYHLLDFAGNYYLQVLSELGFAGIFLVLFIFFLIAKKSFNYFLDKNKNASLKRGDWLASGLFISFMVMLVVLVFGPHTNFTEIQFLFWLVIGLIIAYLNINSPDNSSSDINSPYISSSAFAHRPVEKKEIKYLKTGSFRKVRFDLTSKIVMVFLILVFGLTLFRSSITDLSINIKQTLYGFENDYGFYNKESEFDKTYRWTALQASEVIIKKGSSIIIPIKSIDLSQYNAAYKAPDLVKIRIDNTLMKVVKLEDYEWHEVEIDLKDFNKEKITVTFYLNNSWVPEELGISSDTRELGIKVGKYIFKD